AAGRPRRPRHRDGRHDDVDGGHYGDDGRDSPYTDYGQGSYRDDVDDGHYEDDGGRGSYQDDGRGSYRDDVTKATTARGATEETT
ncbi:hypothetical protein THAOC_20184, partial [Thalassiosira oceanica]